MKYQTAKDNVFCHLRRPEGYNGDTTIVGIALIDNKLIEVADVGCYGAPVTMALDNAEANWLIDNHPSFKNYKRV